MSEYDVIVVGAGNAAQAAALSAKESGADKVVILEKAHEEMRGGNTHWSGGILRIAFDDSRMEFDVRFYLVAILFIIFDLEIAFLFPWAISLGSLGALGFWSMMIFLAILTIGFIYEWKKGALEWE